MTAMHSYKRDDGFRRGIAVALFYLSPIRFDELSR
ncbi:hypothetical protein AXFE_00650 [Acidithrix ferrooxidans]|uniref:Uncharacterized protein n=1 Tax=Acidithrix ferrooxidans TaxID=1280514 RepID=A0A0D8HM78_9ACTN|nr:hypothetical protein AXFE_00650 [Acidithrix ferrooxidans]